MYTSLIVFFYVGSGGFLKSSCFPMRHLTNRAISQLLKAICFSSNDQRHCMTVAFQTKSLLLKQDYFFGNPIKGLCESGCLQWCVHEKWLGTAPINRIHDTVWYAISTPGERNSANRRQNYFYNNRMLTIFQLSWHFALFSKLCGWLSAWVICIALFVYIDTVLWQVKL